MVDSSEIIVIAVKFDDCYQTHGMAYDSKQQLKKTKKEKRFPSLPWTGQFAKQFCHHTSQITISKSKFQAKLDFNMKH